MASGRARAQRESLTELLARVGPASPTLCEGWTAHDLAAHLVTREHTPWAAPGLLIGPLHGITERAERSTMRTHSFPELVRMFGAGPPWWNPTRIGLIDDATNLVEFYVHTQDVRRALPDWRPDAADEADEAPDESSRDVMWTAMRLAGLAGFRHSPVGVVAERSDRPGRLTLRRREPVVEIVGPAEELLLYAYGRREVARVELRGDPEAIAALREVPVGL